MPKNADKKQDVNGYTNSNEDVLQELISIRKLLTIVLAKLGSDSGEIGKALGVEPRRIREWVSFQGIKQISEKVDKKADKGVKRVSKKTKTEEKKETEPATEELDKE